MALNAVFKQFGPFFQAGALVGAPRLYHYLPGTTTLKNAWTDRAKTTTAAQPIVGDANGIVSAYFDGLYKLVVKDSNDVTLYTWDNVFFPDHEFADDLFRVTGSGDATKQVALEVDGLPPNTTRTYTAANKDGTLALTSDLETPTVNILPNTQWQVCTGLASATKQVEAGTGGIAVTSVSSYTTGSNTVVLSAADTSLLTVGDIVSMSPAAHANLKICTLEIESIVTNTSFTVKLPINLTGAASAACTAEPRVAGDLTGTTGDGPDGWSKTTALLCWRDLWPSNAKAGSQYSVGLRKSAGTDQLFWHAISADDVYALRGRTIVFGVWVYHKVKGGSGTWQAEITTNGTGGTTTASSAATTTAYEWKEVSVTVPTDATTVTLGINLKGNGSDVYYVSQPMAGYGSVIGSGKYVRQPGEWLIPVVKMTPLSYVGASITFPASLDASGVTYGFAWRVYAETNGAIAPTVRALSMQFEGKDDALATAFAFRNQEATPHIYGILNYCTVVNQFMSSEGIVTLKNGKAWVYGNTASATWFSCSIDINHIRLN